MEKGAFSSIWAIREAGRNESWTNMGETERMLLKHLARNAESICVLNRMILIIWHYRKPMNIPNWTVSWVASKWVLRLLAFSSLPFAFATPKANSVLWRSFLPSFPPFLPLFLSLFLLPSSLFFCLFVFYLINMEAIRVRETWEVCKQNMILEWFVGLNRKREGIKRETNANCWVSWLTFIGPLFWLLIPCFGSTEINVSHGLRWAEHVCGQ